MLGKGSRCCGETGIAAAIGPCDGTVGGAASGTLRRPTKVPEGTRDGVTVRNDTGVAEGGDVSLQLRLVGRNLVEVRLHGRVGICRCVVGRRWIAGVVLALAAATAALATIAVARRCRSRT